MTDYISREDALHFAQNDSEIYIAINCLPAADVVERPQGKWLDVQDPLDIYVECECSLCHERYFKLSNSKDFRWIPFNYCPNCGARMVTNAENTI